jgi:hypothetical protein
VNAVKTGFAVWHGVVQFHGDRDLNRGIVMASVTVEQELPQDWKRFQMPAALQARLSSLLDEL